MIYTGNTIINQVYAVLKDSDLVKKSIGGKLYKRGTRPTDSAAEDAVIGFLSGTAEQVQEGFIVLNVYVPNLKTKAGNTMCNIARCQTIEQLLVGIPDLLTAHGNIQFKPSDMICTIEEPEINQHFVSLKMRFKVLSTKN